MSLRQRAAESLVWTVVESAGLTVLSFVTLVIVARYVAPTDLGEVTVALAIVQILALPVEVLFHDALVQGDRTNDRSYNSAFTGSVVIAIVLTSCCWLARGWISDLFGGGRTGLLLGVLSLSLLPLALGSSLVAQARRELDFRPLALRSLIGRLVGATAGVGCAFAGMGVWSLVVQQLAMTTFATLMLWLLAGGTRPHFTIRMASARAMAGFSAASLGNTFLVVAEPRVFATLVAGTLSPAAAGYLNLAFRVVDMPRDVMANASSQLALPLLRRIRDDVAATRRAYREAVGFSCIVGYPVFFGLAACAPEVTTLVFGSTWRPAALPVAVLSVLTVAFFPRLYSGAVMAAKGMPLSFTPVLMISTGTVVGGMLLVSHQPLVFALGVWAARLVTSYPAEALILRRLGGLRIRDQIYGVFRPLVAATVMAMLAWTVGNVLLGDASPSLRLLCMVLVGGISYPVLIWIVDREGIGSLLGFASMIRGRTAQDAAGHPSPEGLQHDGD